MRLKVTTENIVCKNCGATQIVKYGHYGKNQLWRCRICGKKFTDNGAVSGGKLPAKCVSSALSMYYEGMSINAICRNLEQNNGIHPSTKTVFYWVNRYSQQAIDKVKDLHPQVGDKWVADETYVRIDKRKRGDAEVENPYVKSKKAKWVIFWDIIDADTRFLLASLVTTTRTKEDARKLMELAAKRAGKIPKVVVTDRLASYLDGIELAYGADATHKQGSPFEIENNTNLIERFHGTLKARTKVMRALRNSETTKNFADGWLFFYNYLRPHQYEEGEKTVTKIPAEVAGLKYPFDDWADVVEPDKKHVTTTVTYGVHRPETPKPKHTRLPRSKTPRIPPKVNGVFSNGKSISRHPFKGAKLIRRLGRRGRK